MSRRVSPWLAAALMLALAGCTVSPSGLDEQNPFTRGGTNEDLRLELVAGGLLHPVDVAFAPGIDNLMWVVEKNGLIRIIWDGINLPEPALDLQGEVETGFWEQGLLSMAFHPAGNRVFVLLTPPSSAHDHGACQESPGEEWTHTVALVEYPYHYPDDWAFDAANGSVLFEESKPRSQHNGGAIRFGPDGMLYVGIGEGGCGELAQRRDNLLGSILRLDVNTAGAYTIPADNPFVGDPDARGEVWQHGLRNPWRMGFDNATGDLWVADVGGFVREEINRIPFSQPGGNHGWNIMEGDVVRVNHTVDRSAFVDPVYAYDTHGEDADGRFRCAIIGGMLYRGEQIPSLQGSFIFSDLCSGAVYALQEDANGTWNERVLVESHRGIVAITPDHDGEILIVNHDMGTVRRIIER